MNPNKENTLRINELFYSIQGESTYMGEPCVFVRLTYCNLRCTYCDTEYAFFEGEERSFGDIIAEIEGFQCNLVEVTGGEPLIQKNVIAFMNRLCNLGYTVLLETGGHMDISVVDKRVVRIMDIKCPSSGESQKVDWNNIGHLTSQDQVKMVIGDRGDYEWAREVLNRHRLTERCTVLLSPVFDKLSNRQLAEWILEDKLAVRFQIQMHKYIWDPLTRGV